ncbi:MAG: hypothetical protein LBL07_15110 [Tannerella sp.]|jgi:hypothetical protein|nr:hypothetical protein [Tannerella sp.]
MSLNNTGYSIPEMRENCVHFLDSNCRFVSAQVPLETPPVVPILGLYVDCHEEGTVFYQPVLSEVIYCIKNKEVYPYYTYHNRSDYKMLSGKEKETLVFDGYGRSKDLSEKWKRDYIVPWGNILVTDNYVYNIFQGKEDVHLFYDKKTGKSIVFDWDKLSKEGNFSTLFLNHIHCAKGDVFYSVPSSYWLHKVLNSIDNMPDGKLKKYLQNMEIDDNPFILSFKIKIPEDTE